MMVKNKTNKRKEKFPTILFIVVALFIVCILPQVSASNWTESLNDNLIFYGTLNDNAANTDVDDSTDTNEGILIGGSNTEDISSGAKIGNGLNLNGVNDTINITQMGTFGSNLTNGVTFSFWIRTNDTANGMITGIVNTGPTNTQLEIGINYSGGGKIHTELRDEVGSRLSAILDSDSGIIDGNDHLVIVTMNGSSNAVGIYVDNVSKALTYAAQTTPDNFIDFDYGFTIGARNSRGTVGEFYEATFNQFGIWNRVLNASEINSLWNSGDGITYGGIVIGDQIINLLSPENNSIYSSDVINFTATFNISGSNPNNYTWKNTTLYVWDSDDAVFDTNYTSLSGNNTITTITINDFIIGDYKWNYIAWYGNDTFSNYTTAVSNYTFEWRPFEIDSQDYNEYVYETDNQRFNLSITTLPDILSVTSKLNYNGSEYTGTTSCLVGVCDIYSIIDIPLISSGESVNYSYYWTITVYDGTSSYSFDTTEETNIQNVTRIHLEKCAGVYTTETVNFTAYTEDNLTRINPFKIQGTFDSWLGSGDVKRSSSFNEVSIASLNLCLTPTNRTQFTNALIEYSFNDANITYVPRNYHFQNASFTNVSNEIRLYLLEAEDSTSFIIKVQDQKLSGVSDALVYIQKYYPEDGEFKTIQIAKTDSNGETIGFYEVETVDYKHIIIKNGEVLLETTSQKVVGKSVPYTLTFTVGDALGFPWSVFEKDTNIQSTLTYNKTSMMVTFTYIDTTGGTTFGNLIVYSLSNSNSTKSAICNVSSIQSSATLTCNMTDYDGSFVAYGYIESEPSDILNFLIATGREIFGREGLLIGVFIIMVAGLAFIWNPTAGIVAMNAAVILTNLIGFMVVSPLYIFAMIAVSFIAIILLKT